MARSALVLSLKDLDIDAEPSDDELAALLDPRTDEPPAVVIPARELAEAIWNDATHPRWPKGSHSAAGKDIAGEFMRVGQSFMHDGHRWEISQIAEGHVIANEASGDIKKTETRVYETTPSPLGPVVTGAVPAPPLPLKGGSSSHAGKGGGNTPITDGLVHPETHDPSLKLPAGSALTEEDWKQFGRVDQLYYRELMSRYGAWTSKGTLASSPYQQQGKLQQVYAKANQEFGSTDATTIVQQALGSQYGSSSGHTLNLVSAFYQIGSSPDALHKAQGRYARAREVQGELNGVVAWDLYNRLRSPDVSVLHKSSDSEGFFGDIVEGQKPVMSALSNSWKTGIWSEPNTLGWAVPIRHIALATDVVGGSFHHEHEFATADRMKVSPDTAVFWTQGQISQASPIHKWLTKQMNSNGAGGYAIKGLSAHLAGKGELPLPPADAEFALKYQPGEKQYVIPPDEFMQQVEAAVAKNPGEAITEKVAVSELDLKPGDVIEGSTPGLRYLVIADGGTPTGLAYLALGKGAPGNYDTPEKKYTFSGWGATRKKVDLHFDIPEPKKPKVEKVYEPSDYAPSGEPVQVKAFNVGDRLRINNDDWEVTSQSSTQTTIKSLTSSAEATVNPLWKTQKLEQTNKFEPTIDGYALYEGQVVVTREPVGAHWNVTLPDGSHAAVSRKELSGFAHPFAPSPPQKGDTFALGGQKMVVTNVLKNGHVRARAAVPGAKVQDFAPTDPTLKHLFRASDYAPGPKGKVGQMPAGAVFSGSPVKVRPYMVLGHEGKQTRVLNLDTGEVSAVSKNKGYATLVDHAAAQEPVPEAMDMTAAPHGEFKAGDKVTLAQLQIGDTFKSLVGTFEVVGETGGNWDLKDTSGGHYNVVKATIPEYEYLGHVEAGESTAAPQSVNPSALPDAVEHGDFAPFSSNAGPGNAYKHDKLKMFADGTVFLDKHGKAWKVKQAGATPIITDGQSLFLVDGNLRGKHADHAKKAVVFQDNSPPVGGVSDGESKTLADGLLPNEGQLSIGELGLGPGDKFLSGGKVWIIQTDKVAKLADSGTEHFYAQFAVPEAASKAGLAEVPAGMIAASALQPGQKIAFGQGLNPYTVVKPPNKSGSFQVTSDQTGIIQAYNVANVPHVWPAAMSSVAAEAPAPAKLGDFLQVGKAMYAKYLGPDSIAKLGDDLIYKRQDGTWWKVGGGKVEVADDAVVTHVALNKPSADDVTPTDVKVDIHEVRDGQVFSVQGKGPYLMLGHGDEGVDGADLKTGHILSAGTEQHGEVTLYSWSGAEPTQTLEPKTTVGDLKAGDKFVVPAGYHGEHQEFEVIDPTPILKGKGTEGDQHYTVVKTKNVAGHLVGYTASTLAPESVTAAPAPAPEAAPPIAGLTAPITPGDPLGDLNVGDSYTFADNFGGGGIVHTVVGKDENAISIKTGGETTEYPLDTPFKSSGLVKYAKAPEGHLPLTPYGSKYGHSGKLVYPHVKDLAFGDTFADKKGQKFTLKATEVQQDGKPVALATDEHGNEVAIPHTFLDKNGAKKLTRVKKLASSEALGPQPVDAEHAAAMETADEWLQDHGVAIPAINKIHAEAAHFKQEEMPAAPWGKVYQMASIVHGDLTAPETDPLKNAIDGSDGAKGADELPKPPEGWHTSPTPIDVGDIAWQPGDQFMDTDGDIHTVATVSDEGVPATHWANAEQGPPMPWPPGTMQTVAWHSSPPSDLVTEPSLNPPDATKAIPNYSAYDLKMTGAAGGTTGAQFAKDEHGTAWLVKGYGGDQDRVATELLANAVYRAMGVKAADAGMWLKNGKAAVAYPLEKGHTQHFSGVDEAKMEALGKDYMLDALLGNYDFVGLADDNVLWNGDVPTRIDQGGTFFYRAQGKPKDFPAVPTDVWSMLTVGQGKTGVKVSEADLRHQAASIADSLTPAKINQLVAEAPFHNEAMKEQIRKNLISRVQWMKGFAEGDPSPVFAVPLDVQAHLAPSFDEYVASQPSGAAGATVEAKNLKPGDKIKPLEGQSVQGNFGHTWVVNGPSDDGEHWSLTNEEGWHSTTIPKDGTLYEHVGYTSHLPDPFAAPREAFDDVPVGEHFEAAGGTWQKVSGSGAKLVSKTAPGQLASVGETVDFGWKGGMVQPVDAPAGLADQHVVDAFLKGVIYAGESLHTRAEVGGIGLYHGDLLLALHHDGGDYVTPVHFKPQVDQYVQAVKAAGASTVYDQVHLEKMAATAPETPMPITPYGSPYQSGGKKPYHKITDLKDGENFRDKTGQLYRVVGPAPGNEGETVTWALPLGKAPDGITVGKPVAIPHTFVDAKTGKSKPTRVRKIEE